jgi:arylsulfatase A-like enzyme
VSRSGSRGPLALALVLGLAGGCGEEREREPARAAGATYDRDGHRLVDGRRPETPLNLVVIVVDTLRADALGGEGDAAGTMPFLASLARRGIAFEDATAPAPWTVPSLASLLTGLLPVRHGCDEPRRPPRLDPSFTTFAEALANGWGYETAAFVAGPWVDEAGGLLQGFETRRRDFMLQGIDTMVEPWVRRRDARRPFFLLLHTFEAHDPYGAEDHPWPEPPQTGSEPPRDLAAVREPWEMARWFLLDREARGALGAAMGQRYVDEVVRYLHSGYRENPRLELAEELRAAYGEGVRWVDGLLARTVERLETWGLLENTVLVVTSDHGEAFGEHGTLEHGRVLYDELVRIPLVMTGPPPFQGGRRIRGGVGLVDVMPTLLDRAGLLALDGTDGVSAMSLVEGTSPGRIVFSQERLNRDNTSEDVEMVRHSIRSARWKVIVTWDQRAGTVVEEVYDLEKDPAERFDLAKSGVADGPFDAALCEALERMRDGVWGSVDSAHRVLHTPYGAGVSRVEAGRPAPCKAR